MYNLKDKMKSGRSKMDVEEELEKEQTCSIREVPSSLGLHKDTVYRRLRQSGRTPTFGKGVTYDWTDSTKNWIVKLVTGNEK
uniref:Uncharacterized protein n=1 Tax=Caenorhabditis japonica TaxID=281687 RepID=A0A8R1E9T9_CAEJA